MCSRRVESVYSWRNLCSCNRSVSIEHLYLLRNLCTMRSLIEANLISVFVENLVVIMIFVNHGTYNNRYTL